MCVCVRERERERERGGGENVYKIKYISVLVFISPVAVKLQVSYVIEQHTMLKTGLTELVVPVHLFANKKY